MKKCRYGKLKEAVKTRNGHRRCKLKPKTKLGRSRDRKHKSGEYHEVRYRKLKRKGKR